ncbi:hypothetical protein SeLEV6574_g02275 [Synchytrium endobioticum]|uniref:Uncharacterized protein n=1 Tax=Synchytrium endobioticum TaxID=286115 RepID=A0A507D922_9FUNG|nr:hypothetical protein SeLEV6574_g02275 [Synchytrium endobioticum]
MESPALLHALLAGGIAGTAVDTVLFPLDTLKTRLQSRQGFRAAGAFRGIYSGLSSAVIGSAPSAGAFFLSYEALKSHLSRRDAIVAIGNPHVVHMLAASGGEIAACTVRVPTEVIKQRMQTGQYTSVPDAVKSILATQGILGFYRGWSSTVFREIPFTCIQFPLYEYLKASYPSFFSHHPNHWEVALCASVAGGIAAACTTPLDVLKTRIMLSTRQGHSPTIGSTFLKIVKDEGWPRLFSGVVPRVLWISLGGSIFLGVYEVAKDAMAGGRIRDTNGCYIDACMTVCTTSNSVLCIGQEVERLSGRRENPRKTDLRVAAAVISHHPPRIPIGSSRQLNDFIIPPALIPNGLSTILRLTQLVAAICFAFVSSFLVANSDMDDWACRGVHVFCVIAYAGSKVVMYLFLIEKLHIVTSFRTRFEDRLWKTNMLLVVPFIGIAILGFIFAGHDFSDADTMETHPGSCLITYGHIFTIPLLSYDSFFSLYLTMYFVISVMGFSWVGDCNINRNEKYMELAKRNLYGSVIAMTSTLSNCLELAIHEHQSGTLCLLLCSSDTVVNALCLWYITSGTQVLHDTTTTQAHQPGATMRYTSSMRMGNQNTATRLNISGVHSHKTTGAFSTAKDELPSIEIEETTELGLCDV